MSHLHEMTRKALEGALIGPHDFILLFSYPMSILLSKSKSFFVHTLGEQRLSSRSATRQMQVHPQKHAAHKEQKRFATIVGDLFSSSSSLHDAEGCLLSYKSS